MARDFFEFLKDETDKEYYLALGSNERVTVKARFQPKVQKAYDRCLEAIADEGKASANKKWREVFGTSVPLKTGESAGSFDDTEQFIEDRYPVDIAHYVAIDCELTQAGWRPGLAAGDAAQEGLAHGEQGPQVRGDVLHGRASLRKDGGVVARDRIDVPISSTSDVSAGVS